MLVDPWTDAPHDLRRLRIALNECVAADQIAQTVQRLTRPPLIFGLSALLDDPEIFSRVTIQLGAGFGFDGDAAAWLLCFKGGRPEPGAAWTALSNNDTK